MKEGFYQIELNKTVWEVPVRYKDLGIIGSGAYGQVCSATDDLMTHETPKTAIKKLARPFQSAIHAKRTYRELRMLKHMKHENIIGLLDVFTPAQSINDFNDVYLVTPLMGADLNNIVKTQKLSDDHVQFLVYQILRGMKYVHSAGIIHRVSVSMIFQSMASEFILFTKVSLSFIVDSTIHIMIFRKNQIFKFWRLILNRVKGLLRPLKEFFLSTLRMQH